MESVIGRAVGASLFQTSVYMLEIFNQCSISTMNRSNEISLLSANYQGLNNKENCYNVLNYSKEIKINIACLQDTHLVESMENLLKIYWDGEVYLNCCRSNARGIAKMIKIEKKTLKVIYWSWILHSKIQNFKL